jgi:hypothetical protein
LVGLVLIAVNDPRLPPSTLGTAEAANPGVNGRVAYVESVPMGTLSRTYSEVYTDGSDRRRLTFDGGVFVMDVVDYDGFPYEVYTRNAAPVWTPDGLTVAYLHYSVEDHG